MLRPYHACHFRTRTPGIERHDLVILWYLTKQRHARGQIVTTRLHLLLMHNAAEIVASQCHAAATGHVSPPTSPQHLAFSTEATDRLSEKVPQPGTDGLINRIRVQRAKQVLS